MNEKEIPDSMARPARLERATCGFEDLSDAKFSKFSNPLILVRFPLKSLKICAEFQFVPFLSIPVYSICSGLFELILEQI
jgi:hypothetical protein